jgi:excisionase family DNA binding protein
MNGRGRKPKVIVTETRIKTLAEAAAFLKCHPKTVERLIKAKKMKASKVGREWRIRQEDLDRFLEEQSNIELEQRK